MSLFSLDKTAAVPVDTHVWQIRQGVPGRAGPRLADQARCGQKCQLVTSGRSGSEGVARR